MLFRCLAFMTYKYDIMIAGDEIIMVTCFLYVRRETLFYPEIFFFRFSLYNLVRGRGSTCLSSGAVSSYYIRTCRGVAYKTEAFY